MVKKNIIKCSQCDMEFPGGFEYREHWEKVHFYPYLKNNSFDTSHVDAVVKDIRKYNARAFIVIKSTIPVGHTKLLQKQFKTKRIIFSPEFLR